MRELARPVDQRYVTNLMNEIGDWETLLKFLWA
jgi:hypothetical protein